VGHGNAVGALDRGLGSGGGAADGDKGWRRGSGDGCVRPGATGWAHNVV
jgi:hypothetical protein